MYVSFDVSIFEGFTYILMFEWVFGNVLWYLSYEMDILWEKEWFSAFAVDL